MKIIVIEPSHAPRVQEISEETAYTEVKAIVGGWLEYLPLLPGADAYIDEEAKIKEKPCVTNGIATNMFKEIIARDGRRMLPGDFIVGPMVIIGNLDKDGNFDGEWHDLPQSIIDDIMSVVNSIVL